jgi:hypothetical protein
MRCVAEGISWSRGSIAAASQERAGEDADGNAELHRRCREATL